MAVGSRPTSPRNAGSADERPSRLSSVTGKWEIGRFQTPIWRPATQSLTNRLPVSLWRRSSSGKSDSPDAVRGVRVQIPQAPRMRDGRSAWGCPRTASEGPLITITVHCL